MECVRDMLGYPELMIPLIREALLEDRVCGYNADGRHCRVKIEDIVSIEAGLTLWDLSLLAGGQDWSKSVFADATAVPNRMYNDKRVRLVGMSSLPATNTEWFAKTGIAYPTPDFPQPQLGRRGAERAKMRIDTYDRFNFESKPKKSNDMEPELDDSMADLALHEGTDTSSRMRRYLRDPSSENYEGNQFYLRQTSADRTTP